MPPELSQNRLAERAKFFRISFCICPKRPVAIIVERLAEILYFSVVLVQPLLLQDCLQQGNVFVGVSPGACISRTTSGARNLPAKICDRRVAQKDFLAIISKPKVFKSVLALGSIRQFTSLNCVVHVKNKQ